MWRIFLPMVTVKLWQKPSLIWQEILNWKYWRKALKPKISWNFSKKVIVNYSRVICLGGQCQSMRSSFRINILPICIPISNYLSEHKLKQWRKLYKPYSARRFFWFTQRRCSECRCRLWSHRVDCSAAVHAQKLCAAFDEDTATRCADFTDNVGVSVAWNGRAAISGYCRGSNSALSWGCGNRVIASAGCIDAKSKVPGARLESIAGKCFFVEIAMSVRKVTAIIGK